jgi:endonuclease/exonuclease/phosphatase family metal-dependent hydrolase
MRLLTWNLRNGAGPRIWMLLQGEVRADIVFLQELDEAPEGVAVAWARVPSTRWGSSIVTTLGIIRPICVPGYEGWVVGGEVASPRGPLFAFSVHVPTSTRQIVRRPYTEEAVRIIGQIRAIIGADSDLQIGGDFNFTLGERHPSEDRETSSDERVALDAIAAAGLVSCWTEAHPKEPLGQTLRWSGDRSPGKTTPYHCDGLLVPKARALGATCTIHVGDRFSVSDHNPISAVLWWRGIGWITQYPCR